MVNGRRAWKKLRGRYKDRYGDPYEGPFQPFKYQLLNARTDNIAQVRSIVNMSETDSCTDSITQ